MVIDTSAFIAILLGEPESPSFIQVIANDIKRLTSVLSALETAIVIESKKGPSGGREFDLLLHEAAIEITPMNADQMQIARKAYQKFGKGRHPANLNLGDCCSYALASYSGEPLLYKGNDFSMTDIASALQ